MTSNQNSVNRAEAILNFWFGSPRDVECYGKEKQFWWSSNAKLDNEIRQLFGSDYEAALRGDYEHWKSEPYSTLALILLFDQIPRNIFRGTSKVYASDNQALETAKIAIAKGFNQQLRLTIEQKFMYLPFSHSEVLEDQKQALILFKLLDNDCWYRYAESYYNVIKRFGRFPHRNRILGRISTSEEKKMIHSYGQ